MVKEPRPGRVKTRLARDIGTIPALWWFRHQTARLLRRVQDPRWQVVLAVAPDAAVTSRALPPLPRIPQGRGNLGDRMARAFKSFQNAQVLIVGADIPGINHSAIATCFAALGRNTAVIGPAPDGGYWAIGLRHPARAPRNLFKNVRWSSPHARADTEATMRGLTIGYGPTLHDVDTAADL